LSPSPALDVAGLPVAEGNTKALETAEREAQEQEAQREEELATPRAEQEREASRSAYASLSAGEAQNLLAEAFPEQLEELNSDPARFLSDLEIERPLGTFGARVSIGEGESAIVESSVPVESDLGGQGEEPVDLALEPAGNGFVPKNPLTEVVLPGSAEEPIQLQSGVEVAIPTGADRGAEALGDENLFYPETASATDTLVSPIAGGVEVFEQLRSPESPEQFRFALGLPPGAVLRASQDGGAEVVSSAGNQLEQVPPPSAIDAQGSEVPLTMSVEGAALVLDVRHRSEEIAYPVLVDPRYNEGNESPPFSGWTPTETAEYLLSQSPSDLAAVSKGSNFNYPANTWGQWEYTAPGETAYIEDANFSNIYFIPHTCPGAQPHGYLGIYNVFSGSYNSLGTYSGGESYSPGFATGKVGGYGTRKATVGIGTGGSSSKLACAHEIYVGGVSVQENDPENPTINSVTGIPSGWIGPSYGSATVVASDPGFGVDLISMYDGGVTSEDHLGCTGMAGSRCPREASWPINPPYKEGERTLKVSAEDPTGKVGQWTTTTKVDFTKPEIDLGGQLAYATEEEGLKGEENEASENQLSLPVYNLHIEATDGSNAEAIKKQSGLKNIEIFLDGAKQTVSWKPQECPTSSCKMEETFQLGLLGLTAGEHKLKVDATDQVGLTREREIDFEYIPATGTENQNLLQHFRLESGEPAEGEESTAPELAVNVMDGNLVFHQQDVEVEGPAADLEVERFYNSELPKEQSSEWGTGWTLAQTPVLEPEETKGGAPPATTAVVGESGSYAGAVELPTEPGASSFAADLQAAITKEPGGGYEVTDESGETAGSLAFDEAGQVEELRTSKYAGLEYEYEGGNLAEIAVEDPGTAGASITGAAEQEEDELRLLASPRAYAGSFGSPGTGNGQFSHPGDVALAPDSTLWVADTADDRVEHFSRSGTYLGQFGSHGSGNGQLYSPRSIAVDAAGDVWVADSGNDRVEEFNPKGEYLQKFGSKGSGNGQFADFGPEGIAIDAAGNVWASDTDNHRLEEFSAKGEFVKSVGSKGTGPGQLEEPQDIAVGHAGNLFVTDYINDRVEEYSEAGEFVGEFGSKGSGNGQFDRPYGIATTANGAIWVADINNDRVEEFTEGGEYVTKFGSEGAGAGQFNFTWPIGLAADAKGNIWVTDPGGGRVERWVPDYPPVYDGSFGSAGTGNGRFSHPGDVALAPDGTLWVADTADDRVEHFSRSGTYLGQFGSHGAGNGQLYSPRSVAVDGAGDIWVADSGNDRVEEFNAKGEYVRKVGSKGSGNGQFADFGPEGIAVDSHGDVWTSDTDNHRLEEFNEKGEFIKSVGSQGTGAGQLEEPQDIAFDPSGDIFVTDYINDRVEEFSESGTYVRQFGSAGSGNGQFNRPYGVAATADGAVWVADINNDRVEEFSEDGEYITQFGSEGNGPGQFEFAWPVGLAADANGDVWVTDPGAERIEKWRLLPGGPPAEGLPPIEAGATVEVASSFGSSGTGNGQFSHPGDVALAPDGTLWVADTADDRVEHFSQAGRYLGQFGSHGSGNGQLYSPRSIAVDATGDVWVGDSGNDRVEEFNPKGEFLQKFGSKGSGSGQFADFGPEGIAVDAAGNVWTSDTDNHRLEEFSAKGGFIKSVGTQGTGPGQLEEPQDIAFDPSGDIFVVDYINDRVEEFSESGTYVRQFGSAGSGEGQFDRPYGIAATANGAIWVADINNDRVEEFGETGEYVTHFGSAGSGPGQFGLTWPIGLAADTEGNIWVTDPGGGRVERWRILPNGVPTDNRPPVEPDPSVEVDVSGGLVESVEGEQAGQINYEHQGELLSAVAGPQGETTYEYDASKRLTKVELPNGTWGEIAYESLGRVKSVTVSIEGGKAKTTSFTYSDEPRETVVTFETEPTTHYQIGADGSVLKWWNAKVPPEIEALSGSLYAQRGEIHPEPITIGDQTLLVHGHSFEGIASIQIVADGSQLVAEKTCEEAKCINLEKELVTNTENWPPGILQLEVIVTDRLGQVSSERFWDNIPYTPPLGSEAPEPPQFAEILRFREEFGLDPDLKGNELALNERIFELIADWHDPNTPLGEVERASAERWGVPLRPQDVAEMEYRERYAAEAARLIPEWAEHHAESTYAGYYIDQRQGGRIHVGFIGGNQSEGLSQLVSEIGEVAPGRISTFESEPGHSYRELLEAWKANSAALAGQPVAKSMVSQAVDMAANKVEVGTEDVAAMETFLAEHLDSADFEVVHSAGRPIFRGLETHPAEWPGHPKHNVREAERRIFSGDAVMDAEGPNLFECTAGWGATERVGSKPTGEDVLAPYLITAGHCFSKGPVVQRFAREGAKYVEFPIGPVTARAFAAPTEGDETDAEAIRLRSGFSPPSWIFAEKGSQLRPGAPAVPVVGEPVCHSGVEGGFTCGTVERLTEQWIGEFPAWLWEANIFSCEGDSGGPYWQPDGNIPLGIEDGGPSHKLPDGRICGAPSYFTPLVESKAEQMGVTVGRNLGVFNAPGLSNMTFYGAVR
jgi:sugar lactone lactonase YvrE